MFMLPKTAGHQLFVLIVVTRQSATFGRIARGL
jgi:hypothetical protein